MKKATDISLFLYEEKNNADVLFLMADLDMMKVLQNIPKDDTIIKLSLMASNEEMEYIYQDDIKNKQSIRDLVIFFSAHSSYSIDDMEMTLKNNIQISIHDDNEICFLSSKNQDYTDFINTLLQNLNYQANDLMTILFQNKNKYLLIQKPALLIKKYVNFDEYWTDITKK